MASLRNFLRNPIRPSRTRSTALLFAKSVLNAILFFAVFMIALPAAAQWLLPMALPLPEVLRTWVAGALALVGMATWMVCLDAFSRVGHGTPLPLDAPRDLVRSGPFGVTRNPIMLAELLVIWAEALYVASVGVWLYAIAISVLAHLAVVRIEEPELRSRFGAAYDEYCRDVPRWMPRLSPRC